MPFSETFADRTAFKSTATRTHSVPKISKLIRSQLTTAGPRSSGTDSVAPRWGSADRTATASGAEHLPGAAEPGSTLPSSTAWRRTKRSRHVG